MVGLRFMPYNPNLMAKFKYEVDGRKWNGEEKWWEFPAVHLPKAFNVFGPTNIKCDDKVLNLLEKLKDRREDLDEIRVKEDVEFDIKGMQLQLPHQVESSMTQLFDVISQQIGKAS